jgi:UDP-N-acetylmuramoyl-tripeptide--D-alanyl-D-alanine ligase
MVSSVAALGLDGTSFDYQGVTMNLPLPGRANFYDALAALAVAQELGLTPEEMKQGLAKVQPLFGRSQVLKGNVTFIQDCYNANPDSMEAALDFFSDLELDSGRKVLVIGDMLELGVASEEAHRAAVSQAQKTGSALMIFLGDAMSAAGNSVCGSGSESVLSQAGKDQDTIQKAVEKLASFLQAGDVVLLKGSRGMGLERITAALQPIFQGGQA